MPTLRPLVAALAAITLPAAADHMEELVVTGQHDTRIISVSDDNLIAPDVSDLLRQVPGAQINRNGPLTGIPQYRGMYGSRVGVTVDNTEIAPAGPNWMDPPLSYAVGGQLDALEVFRGIAPVGVAQESIGGAITARTRTPAFGNSDAFGVGGQVIGSAQSANEGYHLQTDLHAANANHRFRLAAMAEGGDDVSFADGDIVPTEYERERYDVGYGFRSGPHTLQFDYGYNDTGDAGTPALPMDIQYIESDLYRLSYNFDGNIPIALSVFGSDLDHGMTNYHLRQAPGAMGWRRNIATADNLGFKLSVRLDDDNGSWQLGIDGHMAEHNSDIDNPNNAMFFVTNFNDAQRDVWGVFVEREQRLSDNWRAEFGARYNRVAMDADEVDGTPAQMMPPAAALRDAFNSADREQDDDNVDVVLRARYRADDTSTWYAGIARKTRSPSYQERYLWLPLEATAGLADGNTYTGNIALDPEVSNQVEFGLDYSDRRLTLAPRIFYNRVDDFIQGTQSNVAPALMFVDMMNNNNGTNGPAPLQFNNVDAELYGFDMDWAYQLSQHWSLGGVVNYVRGKRRDTNDDLYRIAPFNTTWRLSYSGERFSATLENELFTEQDDISAAQREQSTDGYGLVNVIASWEASDTLTLTGGVNNLFDRDYESHLSGYNRAQNADIPLGSRLPGAGANIFARAVYTF